MSGATRWERDAPLDYTAEVIPARDVPRIVIAERAGGPGARTRYTDLFTGEAAGWAPGATSPEWLRYVPVTALVTMLVDPP